MARTTGAATSLSALLSAISTAAVAQGWTEEERYTEGDNSYDLLVLSNPEGFYYYLAQDGTDIIIELSKSYTATIGWNSIPDKSGHNTKVEGLTFPLVSHAMYASATDVHITAEFEALRFAHFSIGTIEKVDAGSWTGGEYAAGCIVRETSSLVSPTQHSILWSDKVATNPTEHTKIRCEGLGAGNDYAVFGEDETGYEYAFGTSLIDGFNLDLLDSVTPNTFNNRARYLPIMIFISDDGSAAPTNTWIPLGYVKNARGINVELLTEKEEDAENLGWYIYPLRKKSVSLDVSPMTSGTRGVAFKE